MRADPTARDILERYIRALHERDLDTMSQLQHEDYVEDYPQSGERIRGRAHYRAILEHYPGGLAGVADLSRDRIIGGDERWMMTPGFTMVRLSGAGERQTAIVKLQYPDGTTWFMVSVFEIHDGLLTRATTFFAPVFAAPEWRRAWVEPIGGD